MNLYIGKSYKIAASAIITGVFFHDLFLADYFDIIQILGKSTAGILLMTVGYMIPKR